MGFSIGLKMRLDKDALHGEFHVRSGGEAEIIAAFEHTRILPVCDFAINSGCCLSGDALPAGGSLPERVSLGPGEIITFNNLP
jgi:hypothetical protein